MLIFREFKVYRSISHKKALSGARIPFYLKNLMYYFINSYKNATYMRNSLSAYRYKHMWSLFIQFDCVQV